MALRSSSQIVQALGLQGTPTVPPADVCDVSAVIVQALGIETTSLELATSQLLSTSSMLTQALGVGATTTPTDLDISSQSIQVLGVGEETLVTQGVSNLITPRALPSGNLLFFWPDWVEGPTLSHEWQTTVRRAPGTTSESRRAGRTRPVRRTSCTISSLNLNHDKFTNAHGTEMTRLIMEGYNKQTVEGPWPLYSEAVQLAQTLTSGNSIVFLKDNPNLREFYPGGRVLFIRKNPDLTERKNHWEIARIASILSNTAIVVTPLSQDWPEGCYVIPLIDAEIMGQVEVDASTGNIGRVRFEVQESLGPGQLLPFDYKQLVTFPVYQDLPVYVPKPNWNLQVTMGNYRDSIEVTQGQGTKRVKSGRSRVKYSITETGCDRSESTRLLSFFDRMLGRLQQFWFVAPMDNPFVVQAQNTTTGYIDIAPMGRVEAIRGLLSGGALAYEVNNAITLATITGVQEVSGVWRISYQGSLPTVTGSNGRLSFAHRVRMETDDLDLRFKTDTVSEASMGFVQVLDEADKAIRKVRVDG